MKPQIENREQALKFIQGKVFAATLLSLMDMSMRGPKPTESHDEFAKRSAEEMEKRHEKTALEIFDALQGLFLSDGHAEPAAPSNDTGEEIGLADMAGSLLKPREGSIMADSHGLKPIKAADYKTGAAILQDEIDRITQGAIKQIESHNAATIKRFADDVKRLVSGLRVNKTA